jgi:hypothetical protein
MKLDVDYLIHIMKKHTFSDVSELDEQDTADAGGAGGGDTAGGAAGGGSKNNVTTWSNIVGAKVSRGKANPLGKAGEKWTSGVARTGPANPVERKKWSDVVQTKRDGPANQLT